MASKSLTQSQTKNNFGGKGNEDTPKQNLTVDVAIKKFTGLGFMTAIIHDNSGERIFVADKDSRVITSICMKRYEILGIFHGHQGAVWSLGISQDDQILISGGADRTLRFYNSFNGSEIFFFDEDSIPGYPKQISVSNNVLMVFYELLATKAKSYIGYYDLNTLSSDGICQIKIDEYEPLYKPSVIKWFDGTKVLIGFNDGSIQFKDYLDDSVDSETIESKKLKFHSSAIRCITINNEKNIIMTGSQDGFVKLIQINDNSQFEVIREFNLGSPITCAIFTFNERKVIATASVEAVNVAFSKNNDFKIKFYGIRENKLINEMSSHFGPVKQLVKCLDSKNIISAGQDGFVRIYLMDQVIEPHSKNTHAKVAQVIQESQIKVEDSNDIIKITDDNIKQDFIEKSDTINPTFGIDLDENSRKLSDEIKYLEYVNIKVPVPVSTSGTGNNVFMPNSKYQDMVAEVPILENKTTIKVSGLPIDIEYEQVRDLFESHGAIEERGGVKVIYGRDDTFAFVKYVFEESASRAIQMKHGCRYEYQILHVELARSR